MVTLLDQKPNQTKGRVIKNNFSVFQLDDLPAFEFDTNQSYATQYANYFKNLLLNPSSSHIIIPTATELSIFFNCCELDILDALYEIKEQGYEYDMYGISSLITIKDKLRVPNINLNVKSFTNKVLSAIF